MDADPCYSFLLDSTYALAYLERQLLTYVSNPELADTPFDLSAVPKISRQDEQERGALDLGVTQSLGARTSTPPHSGSASNGGGARPVVSTTPSLDQQAFYAQQLAEVREFASFGPLFKSTAKPVELTESETEYVVSCVKHVFAHHVVFQV